MPCAQYLQARHGIALLFLAICGCGAPEPSVTLQPPAGWHTIPLHAVPVPGQALRAWAGPSDATLVLYRTLPAPGATAVSVVSALANRLENLPGIKLLKQEPADFGSLRGMRLDVDGLGYGGRMAASSTGTFDIDQTGQLAPTREVTVAAVLQSGVYYLTWHTKTEHAAQLEPDIKATLERVRIGADPDPATYSNP